MARVNNFNYLLRGGLGALILSGCVDLGYVVTDPDPTYPDDSYPDSTVGPTTNSVPTTTDAGQTTSDGALTTTGLEVTSDVTLEPDPTTGVIPTTAVTTGDGVDTDTDTDTDTASIPAECGNGVVEADESCDDGNQDVGDGCEPDCTLTPVCGNGSVESGEVCDDGNVIDGDECSADCQVSTVALCGDGTVEGDEQCDDGNLDPTDGCEPDCTFTPGICGDGFINFGEQCDDGNVIDGDGCEGDCTVPVVCLAPVDYVVCDEGLDLADKTDPLVIQKALGICNDQGDNSVLTANFTLGSDGDAAWQVARGFGTFKFDHDADPNTPDELFYRPREGDSLLILSTGTIAAPDPKGVVVEVANSQVVNGDNGNDDSDELPPPFAHEVGSSGGVGGTPFLGCDGSHDCSDTLAADWQALPDPNDAVWFTLHTGVPAGVFGYTFDLVFCSSEWPASLGKPENDVVIAWQTDPTPDGYTGNVAHLPNPNDAAAARPLTLSTLHPHFLGPGFVFAEPQLAGTGFENHACSSWLQVRGGTQPGADLQLGFYLADRGDSERASVALLDNFRWDCAGCVPEAVDECGVATAP